MLLELRFAVFLFELEYISIHGSSPWERTHGAPFLHERFPFGSLVVFKPNEVRTTDHKWAPKAELECLLDAESVQDTNGEMSTWHGD